MTKGNVLVLVSSSHDLPLKDGKGLYRRRLLSQRADGFGSRPDEGGLLKSPFANPKGNTPQMDVTSAVAGFFGGDEAKLQDYLKFRDTLTGLKNPTPISGCHRIGSGSV